MPQPNDCLNIISLWGVMEMGFVSGQLVQIFIKSEATFVRDCPNITQN